MLLVTTDEVDYDNLAVYRVILMSIKDCLNSPSNLAMRKSYYANMSAAQNYKEVYKRNLLKIIEHRIDFLKGDLVASAIQCYPECRNILSRNVKKALKFNMYLLEHYY